MNKSMNKLQKEPNTIEILQTIRSHAIITEYITYSTPAHKIEELSGECEDPEAVFKKLIKDGDAEELHSVVEVDDITEVHEVEYEEGDYIDDRQERLNKLQEALEVNILSDWDHNDVVDEMKGLLAIVTGGQTNE